MNAAQVAIGHRVGQAVFQPQQSLHYRLKHEIGATLNSVSGLYGLQCLQRGSVFTALHRTMTGATPKLPGIRESSALRFASYLWRRKA